jgi:hypothetical protein
MHCPYITRIAAPLLHPMNCLTAQFKHGKSLLTLFDHAASQTDSKHDAHSKSQHELHTHAPGALLARLATLNKKAAACADYGEQRQHPPKAEPVPQQGLRQGAQAQHQGQQ